MDCGLPKWRGLRDDDLVSAIHEGLGFHHYSLASLLFVSSPSCPVLRGLANHRDNRTATGSPLPTVWRSPTRQRWLAARPCPAVRGWRGRPVGSSAHPA